MTENFNRLSNEDMIMETTKTDNRLEVIDIIGTDDLLKKKERLAKLKLAAQNPNPKLATEIIVLEETIKEDERKLKNIEAHKPKKPIFKLILKAGRLVDQILILCYIFRLTEP